MRALARFAIRLLSVLSLAGLFFDGVGYDAPLRNLPGPFRYAIEVAALFPDAAKSVSEYRAEAWVCRERRWEELDTRKYFPLDPDDKENRFQRILHFYNGDIFLKRALDTYLADSHNHPDTYVADDGIGRKLTVGGVRFSVLRSPIPTPGDKLTRYRIIPLKELGPNTVKNVFYEPTRAELNARCESKRNGPPPRPVLERPQSPVDAEPPTDGSTSESSPNPPVDAAASEPHR